MKSVLPIIGRLIAVSASLTAASLACSPPAHTRVDAIGGDATAQIVIEDGSDIPCEARRALQTVCQTCHSRPPRGGAPFALVGLTDITAMHSGVVVRELMIQQLEAGRMPLSPVTIEPEAREALLEWLREGAPPVPAQQCKDKSDLDAGSDADLDAEVK